MKSEKKPSRKTLILIVSLAIMVPVLASAAGWTMARAGYTIIANLTPSIPVGLYLANANRRGAERGYLVTFAPHNEAAQYAFMRGWMKPDSLYIKRVAAVEGDMVCADHDLTIRTRGVGETAAFVRVGEISEIDNAGRPLPHMLSGCQPVPEGQFLPVGDGLPNSYDGRYYGFVPVAEIRANLRPLWTQSQVKE